MRKLSGIGALSRFWRYCLDPLVYLQQKRFKLFGFPAFRHGAVMFHVNNTFVLHTRERHYQNNINRLYNTAIKALLLRY
jgi:hypothetical protein